MFIKEILDMKQCPQCKTKNSDESKSCAHCGAGLKENAVEKKSRNSTISDITETFEYILAFLLFSLWVYGKFNHQFYDEYLWKIVVGSIVLACILEPIRRKCK